jgi:hypothetical protein
MRLGFEVDVALEGDVIYCVLLCAPSGLDLYRQRPNAVCFPAMPAHQTISRWIAPGLRRYCAAHCRSVHQPALRQVVVLHRPMLHGAIVPEQQIIRSPLVAIDEGWLDNVIG